MKYAFNYPELFSGNEIKRDSAEMELPLVKVKRKTGSEVFTYNGRGQKCCLKDFWAWSSSDLLGNTARGILAEFIVAMALGQNRDLSAAWGAYDFKTQHGTKIEVKSAAYIQSWYQKGFSKISFNVRPTKAWNPETNTFDKEAKRQADIYVFCLLKHLDQNTIDPLNLNQWEFYILATNKIEKDFPRAKTLTLRKLKSLNPAICSYDKLHHYLKIETV